MKNALITGVAGQDGSYLAEYLLKIKGYNVFGMIRPTARRHTGVLARLVATPNFKLLHGDMLDSESLKKCVEQSSPDEVYNLAAISYAPASWQCPAVTMATNAGGVTKLLEAVRRTVPKARVYQASTSEMFGAVAESPQSEKTPFRPVHPYGVAKVAGHWNAVCFREQYQMHVSCGILFNHESERRGDLFVTQKVCEAAVAHMEGRRREPLSLWTLSSTRDWGYAKDYVQAMHLILQIDEPIDVVVGTGVGHTVGDLVKEAYEACNLDWEKYVVVEPPSWFKPDDRAHFIADTKKMIEVLAWYPEHNFKDLVKLMLDSHKTLDL